MTAVYQDENVAIEPVGPLGPQQNNAYIVRPRAETGVIVVDAPEGSEEVVRGSWRHRRASDRDHTFAPRPLGWHRGAARRRRCSRAHERGGDRA